MSPILRTPNLQHALADYTDVLGFECQQHIPGVFALLVHGPLRLQLWAYSAQPGRWEKPDPRQRDWAPRHHSVVVREIHALHASLQSAILKPVRTALSGSRALHAHRLPDNVPTLQPWGSWEFAFEDVDGQTIHCVDWGVYQPEPDALLQRNTGSQDPQRQAWLDKPQAGARDD